MKKLIVVFLLCSLWINAQSNAVNGKTIKYIGIYPGFDSVDLSDNSFIYLNTGGMGYKGIEYPGRIELRNFEFLEEGSIPFLFCSGVKKVLILKDALICITISPKLVDDLDSPFFIGIVKGSENAYSISGVMDATASSSLRESTKDYAPTRIGELHLESPWAEGATGQGIGEWINFKTGDGTNRIGKPVGVYIINGYISYDHPERYIQNSRIKRLSLTSIKSGKQKHFMIEDSSQPQLLDIQGLDGYVFTLTIEDVYPGTKYTDTCIGGVLSLNIPWNGPVPSDY